MTLHLGLQGEPWAAQERTGKQKTPQNTVNLQTSTVKADAEDTKDKDLRFCFRIVSRDRMYLLQVCDHVLASLPFARIFVVREALCRCSRHKSVPRKHRVMVECIRPRIRLPSRYPTSCCGTAAIMSASYMFVRWFSACTDYVGIREPVPNDHASGKVLLCVESIGTWMLEGNISANLRPVHVFNLRLP